MVTPCPEFSDGFVALRFKLQPVRSHNEGVVFFYALRNGVIVGVILYFKYNTTFFKSPNSPEGRINPAE